jgi:hypothetical protein
VMNIGWAGVCFEVANKLLILKNISNFIALFVRLKFIERSEKQFVSRTIPKARRFGNSGKNLYK